ncbi:MAG: major facilitator superfamily 1 [Burkholderiaceae bacterium]|jgi:ACS family hexuronate transporter-like MFS transporter|nr:major facilitator superfamily 1 [Burkholderiaceae bacterium]
MNTKNRDSASRRVRRLLVALIFCAAALNYVDRQVLALLKPILQGEFAWDNQDFAHLGSVFQLSAAIALPFVGWFVDRIGVRWGYLIAVGVWSLAGIAHAFATSMQQFVTARAVLAVAESVHTPAAVKSMATYLPIKERSLGIGLMNTAPNVGAILTPLLIPPIALAFGWKAAFIVTGALGFVWILFWWPSVRNLEPVHPETVPTAAIRSTVVWSQLFRDRRTWAFVGAKLLVDQVWWFILFWTPDFFHRVFGMSQAQLGWPIAIIYTMAAIGALSSGMLFPRLLDKGYAVDRARKLPMLVYALLILPVPLAITVGSPWTAALIIGLALFAHQGFMTNLFGLAADVVPPSVVATVIALGAVAGNLSGTAIIELAGWSLENGHGYWPMFAICGSAYLLALAWIHFMLPRLRLSDESDLAPAR